MYKNQIINGIQFYMLYIVTTSATLHDIFKIFFVSYYINKPQYIYYSIIFPDI